MSTIIVTKATGTEPRTYAPRTDFIALGHPSSKTDYGAVVVAGFAAFVMSSLYYSPPLLGNLWRAVDPIGADANFSLWKLPVEILRTFGVTYVVARLLAMLGRDGVRNAVKLALLLWFGFSGLMWVGAVMWERSPWQVAAIHSGDWLVKIVLISSMLTVWNGRRRSAAKKAA
jgi:hypothetical protein